MIQLARRRLSKASHPSLSSSSAAPPPPSAFVSKHFAVSLSELKSVVESMRTEFRVAGDHLEVKHCKLCSKGNRDKPDNLWKLYVNSNGSFCCFRCNEKGSWFELKRRAAPGGGGGEGGGDPVYLDSLLTLPGGSNSGGSYRGSTNSSSNGMKLGPTGSGAALRSAVAVPDQSAAFQYTKALFAKHRSAVADSVLKYLVDVRKLSEKTLQRYGVGCSVINFMNEAGEFVPEPCATFPWLRAKTAEDVGTDPDADLAGAVTARTEDGALLAPGGDGCVEGLSSREDAPQPSTGPRADFIIERVKHRALSGKGKQRLHPKGGAWGFFGWHLVRPESDTVIITEGEFDAMAVSEALANLPEGHDLYRVPAISLPNGCNSFPPELIMRLERFSRIILWMDNDDPGLASADKFARKLGIHRTMLVNPPTLSVKDLMLPTMTVASPETSFAFPKDANDALRSGFDIVKMIQNAHMLRHSGILQFSDIRNQVLSSLQGKAQYQGTTTPSLPGLTRIIKGFRRGELVVFTGATGSGKTTLLSQLSIDFAKQGARTLWGSFEIKNHILVRKMLRQYYNGDVPFLNLSESKLNEVADEFESLPLSFLNFHSGTDLEKVVEAMEFAVYRDDIEHVILDNLQFMMPRIGASGGSFQKFDMQDAVIDRFRSFATEKNINIILVIHPKKDDDKLPLGISSVFGTAKATQEADAVIILQKDEKRKYVEIKKNRHDGDLGVVNIGFSPLTGQFYELG